MSSQPLPSIAAVSEPVEPPNEVVVSPVTCAMDAAFLAVPGFETVPLKHQTEDRDMPTAAPQLLAVEDAPRPPDPTVAEEPATAMLAITDGPCSATLSEGAHKPLGFTFSEELTAAMSTVAAGECPATAIDPTDVAVVENVSQDQGKEHMFISGTAVTPKDMLDQRTAVYLLEEG